MKSNIVNCDKCKGDFDMSSTKINLVNDIEETYFNCHLCGEFYSIIKTDTEIRKLIDKQNYMRTKIAKKKASSITAEEIELFNKREAEIKRLVEELDKKVVV